MTEADPLHCVHITVLLLVRFSSGVWFTAELYLVLTDEVKAAPFKKNLQNLETLLNHNVNVFISTTRSLKNDSMPAK